MSLGLIWSYFLEHVFDNKAYSPCYQEYGCMRVFDTRNLCRIVALIFLSVHFKYHICDKTKGQVKITFN